MLNTDALPWIFNVFSATLVTALSDTPEVRAIRSNFPAGLARTGLPMGLITPVRGSIRNAWPTTAPSTADSKTPSAPPLLSC